MFTTVVQLDDFKAEKTDDGLLIHYESQLSIDESKRLAIRLFFIFWNTMVGLFACVALAMIVFTLFIEKEWVKLIPILLFLALFFVVLYHFHLLGRNVSAGLTGERPFIGWKITISRDQWRSQFSEVWKHHDKNIPIESIKEIIFDQQNRVIAISSGKRIPLTTPLSDDARDWFREKLTGFLSASSG